MNINTLPHKKKGNKEVIIDVPLFEKIKRRSGINTNNILEFKPKKPVEGNNNEIRDKQPSVEIEYSTSVSELLNKYKSLAESIREDGKILKKVFDTGIDTEKSDLFFALEDIYKQITDILPSDLLNKVDNPLELEIKDMVRRAKAGEKLVPKYQRIVHKDPVSYLEKYFGKYLAKYNKDKTSYLTQKDISVIAGSSYVSTLRSYLDRKNGVGTFSNYITPSK